MLWSMTLEGEREGSSEEGRVRAITRRTWTSPMFQEEETLEQRPCGLREKTLVKECQKVTWLEGMKRQSQTRMKGRALGGHQEAKP